MFASSGVKLFMILNSNMTFGFADGEGIVAAGGTQWVQTIIKGSSIITVKLN